MAHLFTFGIEEEYFLVDAQTKLVTRRMPEAFFKAAEAATGGRIAREFLQAQVEVVTSPHSSMADAHSELRFLRQTVAAVAAEHGLGGDALDAVLAIPIDKPTNQRNIIL